MDRGSSSAPDETMLANLARLLEHVDVLFAKLRVGIGRIVRVDQLRKPQRASHPRRPAADDDHISRHLRTFNTFNRFSENDHLTSLSQIPSPQIQRNAAANRLSQGVWYAQLLADPNRGRILDLTMPRNSTGTLGDWIVIDAVAGSSPGAACIRLLQDGGSGQHASHQATEIFIFSRVIFLPGVRFPANSRLASSNSSIASRRFSRASSRVSPSDMAPGNSSV